MSTIAQNLVPTSSARLAEVINRETELPVIDIGPFLAGAPGAEAQLVADIRLIQTTLGFYVIVNHPVDVGLVDDLVEETRRLFNQPEERLRAYAHDRHMQGYWGPDSVENIRPGFEEEVEKRSTLAGWVFGRERSPTDPEVASGRPHRALNKWPDPAFAPRFRPVMLAYQEQMLALGQRLIPVYAQVLGLPANYFDSDFKKPEWYVRCNYHGGGGTGMFVNAHSDHSFLTLLPMSKVPGLQVRTPSHTWIDVTYIEGGIVVNTGEWLNRLSNGQLIATPHRVTQPRSERISIPFFMDPDDSAIDTPVPGSVEPGRPRKFEPRTFGEFYANYIDALTLPEGK